MSLSSCMVLGGVLISFFTCSCPVFPAPLIEEAIFSALYILAFFVKNKVPLGTWVYFWAILFYWSVFLFLFQYHTVLMTVALYCNLKSRRLIPKAPFFFLKTALAIQGLCISIRIVKFFVLTVKNAFGNLVGIALNL